MLSQEIRRSFLKYFQTQGHTIVPSSPVIPYDDPTLLFINAGMNQFKDVFLGKSKRDYTRATSTQKCIRVGGKHNDLENVGHTTRHLTFFEMLGNFSFGDYFKNQAIGYAWDIALHVFGFDPDHIWASVYKDDDEAFSLWEKHLPQKRIVRFGEKENFWAMGETGPCGPCSELLYDRGSKYGSAKSPLEDLSGERYLEFWNLVFMEFFKDEEGKMHPLPKKSIDTGAGLERVVSLKMGVETVFQTDVLRALIAGVENLSKKKYEGQASFHVIADHIRSLSFAIADGVQPSNTDRGYVLRKILRRAVRYGRMLRLNEPFLAKIFPTLLDLMGSDFPELNASKSRIEEILTLEEEAFIRTLTRGGQLLQTVIEESGSKKKISGEDAFKLKDTYGFPIDEVELIAKDEGLQVDLKRFSELEEEARNKSKKAHKSQKQDFDQNLFEDFSKTHKPVEFVGYLQNEIEAHVIAIIEKGAFTDTMKDEGMIILDKTPFYAEMGGQVGDTGTLDGFEVYDCIQVYPGVIAHVGKMKSGSIRKGQKVNARIDVSRRKQIQNNHTATHILHFALHKVLGEHIKQAGSLVDDHRLRFDFSHHKALSKEELEQIEDLVNDKIREDVDVDAYEMKYEKARENQEIKQFFGDKYGDKVRVIDLDFSKELCGGTHTSRTGTIGLFKIAKESSVAAGVRRIEALTAKAAEMHVRESEDLLSVLSQTLKTPISSLSEKIEQLLEENKELTGIIKAFRKEKLKKLATDCLSEKEKVGEISFIGKEIEIDPKEVNEFILEMIQRLKSGVVALGLHIGERCQLVIAVSPDLVEKKVSASNLIKEIAPLIEGGGGGRPNLAQAGGKNPKGLKSALEKLRMLL